MILFTIKNLAKETKNTRFGIFNNYNVTIFFFKIAETNAFYVLKLNITTYKLLIILFNKIHLNNL